MDRVNKSLLRKQTNAESMQNEFRMALQGIREEFDDHLDSINENTNEIQANYEYVTRLEMKMDKLAEKIEQLQIAVSRFTGIATEADTEPDAITLTEREKQVFLVLYTASETSPVTYAQIAKAVNDSEFLVRGYVTNMMEKGIPLHKRYMNNTAYLFLDTRFKERQAKENVLNLHQKTITNF